jgi:hypothetical protein
VCRDLEDRQRLPQCAGGWKSSTLAPLIYDQSY